MHLDISQFHSVLAADGWQAHLNRLFRLGISHKILFGTCWPSYRLSESLPGLVTAFAKGQPAVAGIKEADRRMIMGGNSLRLVGAARTESKAALGGESTTTDTITDRGGRA
ncbi:hypothetical protein SMD44_08310 [Streptomyces alboflavus]|uniref:Amidohydrolase-related domain-containing protein n=1 Tax=Streptomyces alboflavus TaxID=67267 RepID=A0A1Z1WQV2_9ACTN|nr:hypothetical protein SMD44_08310 [Streptomyces alboflavus]